MQTKTQMEDQSRPQPELTRFSTTEETGHYYIRGNPWRFSHSRNSKVYQFCLICGTKKYDDVTWRKKFVARKFFVCTKRPCDSPTNSKRMQMLIPPELLSIRSIMDRERKRRTRNEKIPSEYYQEIPDLIVRGDNDL